MAECSSRRIVRQTRSTIGPWRSSSAENAASAVAAGPVAKCSSNWPSPALEAAPTSKSPPRSRSEALLVLLNMNACSLDGAVCSRRLAVVYIE